MSFSEEGFSAAIKLLAELNGLDEELAGELMVYIGDTPKEDGEGWVIAKDRQGKEYRLRWPNEDEVDDDSDEEDSEFKPEPDKTHADEPFDPTAAPP